jgi:Tfp pilus assembly PilM family ATPase
MSLSFFSKNTIGLDVADRSMEIVELSGTDTVLHKARIVLPIGIVEKGRIKDRGKLIEITNSLVRDAKITDLERKTLIFGLPESQTFVHILDIEMGAEKIEDAVRNGLRTIIPVEFDSVSFSYSVCEQKADGKLRVTAITAQKEIIAEWKNFFAGFGIEKLMFGTEAFAAYMALGNENNLLPVCVVDIGSEVTMVSLYDAYGACFSSSIARAGDFMTEKGTEATGFTFDEVEKIKCVYGIPVTDDKGFTKRNISSGDINSMVLQSPQAEKAFKAVLNGIITDIKKNLKYCIKKRGLDVSNIILIGGTSQLPGISEYFRRKMKDCTIISGASPYLSGPDDFFYIEAVGLALYPKNKDRFPMFDISSSVEKKEEKKVKNKYNVKKPVPIVKEREEKNEKKKEKEKGREQEKVFVIDAEKELKLKKQEIILLAIILFGAVLLWSAFRYNSINEKKHQAEIASSLQNYYFVETMPFSMLITINADKVANGGIAGRIVTDRVQLVGEQHEAIESVKNISDETTGKKRIILAGTFKHFVIYAAVPHQ